MTISELKLNKSQYKIIAVVLLCIICVIVYSTFFRPLSASNQTEYVYIDGDDTVDSVFHKVEIAAHDKHINGFRTLIRYSKYENNIRTGRYEIKPGDSSFKVFRRIKNGQQTPLNIIIPSVRTIDKLSAELSEKLMLDSISLLDSLKDESFCKQYGFDTTTIACIFIPNTYEVYWNITINKFMDRMSSEYNNFWNSERKNKASALKLSITEVMTMASIIDEETSNNKEKPMIAGMYYNRLKIDMPLQADPTIKFARKDFSARRIYTSWLNINSPYNTYKNTGLPPGPIRIPSVAGIDAVLNLVHHDYLYMCAKEDFSGTHNFAVTYQEHLINAAKYSAALNARGIK